MVESLVKPLVFVKVDLKEQYMVENLVEMMVNLQVVKLVNYLVLQMVVD